MAKLRYRLRCLFEGTTILLRHKRSVWSGKHEAGKEHDRTFLAQQVVNYYTEDQVAVLTALTQNFVTFNHWHSDLPGPTNPNLVALHSGTSVGYGANSFEHGSMTLRSTFQQLTESN
ncbi:hypothetical protein AC579_5656 [Pseudocercospora musae]|uniref:Uncharacterized protein n=1 Tax=Pseudocercospora musae TaxID=113226 RepID=A0A139IC40_9PEZI|nr:hypothetical protein AC579_5656 [Pseudocercospora musae]